MHTPTLPRAAIALLTLAASVLPTWAQAQAADPTVPSATSAWGLGIGVGSKRSPYAGDDDKTRLLPILTYDSERFKLVGTTLDWKLGSSGPLSFTLRARYDLSSGYEADDSPMLSGMDERKAGLWLGGQMSWDAGFAKLSAELLGAAGQSKGAQARLGIERDFRAGSFMFTPRAAAVWQDKKYVDYYYGVKASEARPGRPGYVGESDVNLELGLRTSYAIDRRQILFLDVSATSLGSKVKDSPIVDQKTLPAVAVGYIYRF